MVLHWNGFFKTNYWRVYVEFTQNEKLRRSFYASLHLDPEKQKKVVSVGG